MNRKKAAMYCDYCNKEILEGDIYYCPDTGDVIHLECLTKWARGMVRICDIDEFLRR